MKIIRTIAVGIGLSALLANAASTWKSNVKIHTAYVMYGVNGVTNLLVVQIPNLAQPGQVLEYTMTIDPNSAASIQKATSLLSAALTSVTTGLPANLLVDGGTLQGVGFTAP